MAQSAAERIAGALQGLEPTEFALRDDSAAHAGHPGASGGGGHYRLLLRSARFTGLSRIERHRLVYDSLGSLMGREIHALSLELLAPDEGPRSCGGPG